MFAGETLDCYIKAGQIASEVRRNIKTIIKEGMPLLKLCETVEDDIRTKGGKPAFPCNICINDIAAHYSSPPTDQKTIPSDSIVKVDLGVHVGGYIADTAITISLNPQYDNLIFAVNVALKNAIKAIRPKTHISDIGTIIQKTIGKYGFKPIRNLSGHQMSRFVLHTGKSIPNISTLPSKRINEGEVYAIEPFLTLASGGGVVKNSKNSYIYRFQKERNLANSDASELLKKIKSDFKSLPFSKRWIDGFEERNIREAFDELLSKRCISSYPVLIEETNAIVAQAEHTVLVTKKGCLVTTK